MRASVLASRATAQAQTSTHKLALGEIKMYLSGELWKSEAVIWERRVIDQMPVEHIEFIVCHDVQSVQDASQWQVMASRIQQQAPVREAGKVFNLGLVDKELCGPNIEHIKIQRELIMGVEGNEEKSPDPSKIYDCSAEQLSPQMPHIST